MKKIIPRNLMLAFSGALLLIASSATLALSTTQITQMKACKLAILNKPKLHDLPMAAISLRPGKKNHVRFSVQWDGVKGHGNCKVNKDGEVKHVKIKEFHRSHKKHHQETSGAEDRQEIDGFWYSANTGNWIDPAGEVCHSCTPENGFPAGKEKESRSGTPNDIDGFYYDRHTGQWRDPDGEVCHSCTPGNGFPAGQ